MAVKLSPIFNSQVVDDTGAPATGWKVYAYAAGSSTAQDTYTTSAGSVAQSNPIIINSLGFPTTGQIWLTAGQTYKLVLTDENDVVQKTEDNISGVNDTSVSIDQWVASGLTPTYIGATSFSLVGDQTTEFHVGRRLKTTNSGGTIYSTITASAYGALTTVTVANDSGTLDAGLSAVSYGLMTTTNPSTPLLTDAYPVVSGSADKTKKARFEVDGLTTGTTRVYTLQDSDDTLVGRATTDTLTNKTIDASTNSVRFPKGFISGFTYANNSGDATNDLDIAAGVCRDATDAVNIVGAALTKQSDAAWSVGTNAGALDTGAVGNSDYYIWAIKRSDTAVVDYLFSLSSTAPTMPANYEYKRLIGWFKRTGGTIVAFHTYENAGGGLELNWDVPTLDVNLSATLTTSRRTDAVKVPLNVSTDAHLNVQLTDNGAYTFAWICCPDQTDAAPSATAAPLYNVGNAGASPNGYGAQLWIKTSSTGTIAARSNTATVDLYAVSTMGFRWARR